MYYAYLNILFGASEFCNYFRIFWIEKFCWDRKLGSGQSFLEVERTNSDFATGVRVQMEVWEKTNKFTVDVWSLDAWKPDLFKIRMQF